jgi:hypothetical protein
MHNYINMKGAAFTHRDERLQRIVNTCPPIASLAAQDAVAAREAKRVRVDRKNCAIEGVQKNAASALPIESRQPPQDPLSVLSCHAATWLEREIPERLVDGLKQTA